jgi:hypothetical protein
MTADGGEIIELARHLMAADPSLAEEVRLALVNPDEYVQLFQKELNRRGIENPRSDLPWIALVSGLANRGRLRELDWKEAPEDVAWKIDHLLSDRPMQPDRWAWLAEWEDKLPHELLPAIAARLAPEGLAVVTLDIDSDSYPMMVVPVGQVEVCQRLAQIAGYGTITDWLTPPTREG